MLTSLNVVRIAAVDCDWTRRSATRCRRRDIGTRCSGRFPSVVGSFTVGAGGAFAEGAGADVGLPPSVLASIAESASLLVTRPPRPVQLQAPQLSAWQAAGLPSRLSRPPRPCPRYR